MMSWWASLPIASAGYAAGLAVFVLSRNPRHRLHQTFAIGMIAFAVMEWGHAMALMSLSDREYVGWHQVALAGQIFLPVPWMAFSLLFGRAETADRHRVRRIGLAAMGLISAGFLLALAFGGFVTDGLILERGGFWFSVFLLLSLTAALANFERTVRAADRSQRWRMKYFLLGLALMFVVMIYGLSQIILYASADRWIAPLFSTAMLIGCALMTFSLVRHRLLDVNVFLSRYVVYNSVTVVVVGAYLLAVGLSAQAVKSLGGDAGGYWSALLVVVGLLALVVLLWSYDARKRVKVFINRHFFKYKHDYRKEWLELTERLSSKPTVDDLAPALATMVSDTFWIRDTTLWLFELPEQDGRLVFGRGGEPPMRWDPATMERLQHLDYPITIADAAAPGHGPRLELDATQRASLDAANVRLLVPLVVQRRLVGVLGLSRPYSGPPLNEEDFDLMKTMAKQAAGALYNAQLSRQLVSAKELETFHAVSTFLIHDLKNFVSMLSLLVDNMGRNFDNPAFRKDALRSLSQTVEKMKRLMDRLRALGRPTEPAYESVDLNGLAQAVLDELAPSLHCRLIGRWGDTPCVRADPGHIRQVLTNLILNAEEAVSGEGEIRVTTALDRGVVSCSVSDTGRGIAPEFLETRLFHPFATTKSQGFGVGLYQCKTIIEAHGGRMTAGSPPGEGATLTFSLPIIHPSAMDTAS